MVPGILKRDIIKYVSLGRKPAQGIDLRSRRLVTNGFDDV